MTPLWTDIVQAIASSVTLLISILGFAFVIVQLRQVRKTIESDTHSKLYTEDFEATKILIEHPSMLKYFRSNADIAQDDELSVTIDEMAGLFCCHFEHVLMQMENLPDHIKPRWADYMKGIYATSPIMQRHLRENSSWYSDRLKILLDGKL